MRIDFVLEYLCSLPPCFKKATGDPARVAGGFLLSSEQTLKTLLVSGREHSPFSGSPL